MNRTGIEYLDLTWSPIVGCEGLGCTIRRVCWAAKQAKRQKQRCELCYLFTPHVHFERFEQPLRRKKSSMIGVSFSGEFYSPMISEWVRQNLYMIMDKCPQHIFIIFTKQPQNIEQPLPKNVWIGTSVNTKRGLWRLETLSRIDTTVRIGSFEPLLEDLGKINLEGIGWLIIGAQTKPNFQPKAEWVYNLSHQASELGIPVFWKNNLTVTHGKRQEFPEETITQ